MSSVNSFLGVDANGECLPGPYRPFGLVRLGPDVRFPQPTSGYGTGRPLERFSHTHVQHLDEVVARCWLMVKETRMHLPHLYTWAAEMVHRTLGEYHNTRDGLPDNEDMGCQSAYYLFHSMGFISVM